MNALEATSVISPYAKAETCGKFMIDETDVGYLLSEIMTVGQEYTLQFWVKSEGDAAVTAGCAVGTITEQAFDVVVLDKAQRKLTFVRIGAPADNWIDGISTGAVKERVVTY